MFNSHMGGTDERSQDILLLWMQGPGTTSLSSTFCVT